MSGKNQSGPRDDGEVLNKAHGRKPGSLPYTITNEQIGGNPVVEVTPGLADLFVRCMVRFKEKGQPLTSKECTRIVRSANPGHTNPSVDFKRLSDAGLVINQEGKPKNRYRMMNENVVVRVRGTGKIVWPFAPKDEAAQAEDAAREEPEPRVESPDAAIDSAQTPLVEGELFEPTDKISKFIEWLRKQFGDLAFTVKMVHLRTTEKINTIGSRIRRLVARGILEIRPQPEGQPRTFWYGFVGGTKQQATEAPKERPAEIIKVTKMKILGPDELLAVIRKAYPDTSFTIAELAERVGMHHATVNDRLGMLVYKGTVVRDGVRAAKKGEKYSNPSLLFRLAPAGLEISHVPAAVDSGADQEVITLDSVSLVVRRLRQEKESLEEPPEPLYELGTSVRILKGQVEALRNELNRSENLLRQKEAELATEEAAWMARQKQVSADLEEAEKAAQSLIVIQRLITKTS